MDEQNDTGDTDGMAGRQRWIATFLPSFFRTIGFWLVVAMIVCAATANTAALLLFLVAFLCLPGLRRRPRQ